MQVGSILKIFISNRLTYKITTSDLESTLRTKLGFFRYTLYRYNIFRRIKVGGIMMTLDGKCQTKPSDEKGDIAR